MGEKNTEKNAEDRDLWISMGSLRLYLAFLNIFELRIYGNELFVLLKMNFLFCWEGESWLTKPENQL